MSDTRPYDEQLPWLQPVEDEDEPRGLSARKMLAALLVVVLAAAIVAATFFWLGRRDTVLNGPPELIHAPPGPYKIKPANPGGLNISAESETAFETSSGEDPNGRLDTSKLPNPPVVEPATEQPKTLPGNETKTPVPVVEQPKAKPTGGAGSVIQLGAFANRTQAERAWTALSTRFASIAALNKMIVPFPGGIRLRAGAPSAADAKQTCDMLKAAGESCFIPQ